ncbi:MAG: 50S ribosomal protein L24 [Candidatus Binatia bacterium]|nr:MAG: 50S ribosomal protein L24 [Candidatus Binatia bacterium]
MAAKIKKGDLVMVVAGKERGKTGRVLRCDPKKSVVFVERLNVVKRHLRARSAQGRQGIVEKEAPIHVSNVMIMCERCNAPVRVGFKRVSSGGSVRVCKRCQEQLDR